MSGENNILEIIATPIVLIVGGIVSLVQWRRSQKLQRAKFAGSIVEKLRSEKDMSEALYLLIDENENWYKDEKFSGTDIEFKVDKFLCHLTYICYLKKKKLIKDDEMVVVDYVIARVGKSDSFNSYMETLGERATDELHTEHTFKDLIERVEIIKKRKIKTIERKIRIKRYVICKLQ